MTATFNLSELFEQVADVAADRTALVSGDRRLTYRELDERANRLAHHLADAGVGPGDHIGLHLLNGTEYLEAMLAAFKLRAVPVNINYRYVARELEHLYGMMDLVGLVVHRRFAAEAAVAAAAIGTMRTFVVVDDDSDGIGARRVDRLRRRAGRRVAGPRLHGPHVGRRVLRVHRGHHRHAQGRDVAARGHLLRIPRRRRDAPGPDPAARGARATA